jgi:hypothetical protein
MFSFLKNLATFGWFFAAMRWLKERICKSEETATPDDKEQPTVSKRVK